MTSGRVPDDFASRHRTFEQVCADVARENERRAEARRYENRVHLLAALIALGLIVLFWSK